MILSAFGLISFNLYDANRAENAATDIIRQLETESTEVVDGELYIGLIEIPALGIRLPIAEECSNDALKISPCRYSGSAAGGNLIVAAHNYRSYFGNIKTLQPGDALNVIELDGTEYRYEVIGLEKMDGTAIETMKSGNWDLTLFTCTMGGQSRLAIRAVLL